MSQNTSTKNDNTTPSQFWQANLLPHTQFSHVGKHPWSLGNVEEFLLTKLRSLHIHFTPKYLTPAFVSLELTRPLSKHPVPLLHLHIKCQSCPLLDTGVGKNLIRKWFPSKLARSSFSSAHESFIEYLRSGRLYMSHRVTGTE